MTEYFCPNCENEVTVPGFCYSCTIHMTFCVDCGDVIEKEESIIVDNGKYICYSCSAKNERKNK